MPGPPPASPATPATRTKSVTFCTHWHPALRYHSDPGRKYKPKRNEPAPGAPDPDLKYYSEPDANSYFEIDYEFLKELRRIARSNCPKCRRRKEKSTGEPRENYVLCNGRYHSEKEHCRLCCRVCGRSTDTLDTLEDDQYSLISKSYSRTLSTTPRPRRERKNSMQSNKSVSFLESSNEGSSKEETNYTAKSFTNDLKRFLLRPAAPRRSLRHKLAASTRTPALRAIRGLWKSY